MERFKYKIRNQHQVYYLTMTVVGWVDLFTRKDCKDIIVDSLNYCISNKGLVVHGYVIMSNHVHLIVRAHPSSCGLSDIVRDFKKFTSKQFIKWFWGNPKESRNQWLEEIFSQFGTSNSNNKYFQLWQQKNHPMIVYLKHFAYQKLKYIHSNPVKAGIVDKPEHYKYSSARFYIKNESCLLPVEDLRLRFER